MGEFSGMANPIFCNIQAVAIQWFFVAGMYWTAVISLQVLFAVIRNNATTSSYQTSFHVGVWVLSGIPAIALLFSGENGTSVYGDATLWCWITEKYNVLKLTLYYAPVWIVFIFNLASYCYVYFYLRKTQKELNLIAGQSSTVKSTLRKSAVRKQSKVIGFISKASNFMLAFAIVWIWNCINGIYNIISPSDPVFGLMLMQAVLLFFNPRPVSRQ